MPSNAKLLPYRSNIPYLSEYCLAPCDPDFPKRAKENGGGFIVGGANYGQGSSREHAALVPLYLGIKAVLAKSFARIHMANLINSGILPLTFENEADYGAIAEGDVLSIENAPAQIRAKGKIAVLNETNAKEIRADIALSDRQREMILAGGLLNYTRKQNK
jgi:aconitate hydratase